MFKLLAILNKPYTLEALHGRHSTVFSRKNESLEQKSTLICYAVVVTVTYIVIGIQRKQCFNTNMFFDLLSSCAELSGCFE